MTKRLAVTASLLFIAARTSGAETNDLNETAPISKDLIVRAWDTSDGLPQNTVNALAQTRDGFLWAGTSGGLARFDGLHFRNFGLADGLQSVHITSLLEDPSGTLWVGTTLGLSRWDSGHFTGLGGTGELASAVVECLAADRNNTLWIGTEKGLFKWRNGAGKLVGPPEGLTPGQVRALLLDSSGTLWVSVVLEGLFKKNGDHFELVTGTNAPISSVYGLLEDCHGTIWAGASDGRLWRWREQAWTLFEPTNGLPRNNVELLSEGENAELWIGARNAGLYRFADGRACNVTPRGMLDGDAVTSLLVDHQGMVWAGTSAGGLHRISRRVLKNWGRAEGIDQPAISSVAEDEAGRFWVCTPNHGIYCSDDGGFNRLNDPEVSGNYPFVYAAISTADGSTWVGGEQCLFRFRAGEKTEAYHKPPVQGQAIRALCADGKALWVGTFNSALFKFDGDGLQIVATNGAFPGGITSFALESHETLWVGTTAGLYRWEHGTPSACRQSDNLLTRNVLALYRDADGTIWIGTQGGGLARLKNGRVFNITTQQGLIDDVVSQIVADDLGYLWLGSNHGLMRVARHELEGLADGRLESVHPLVVGRNDGMVKEQCGRGHSPTALKTKDGRLLFPTAGGVVEIEPRSFTNRHSVSPQAVLDGLLIDGQPRNFEKAVVIPPGNHRMELAFTAPSLAGGEWVRFRYRLKEGLQDWLMAGTRRTVTYGKLQPGKYLFEVAASDASGIWNDKPASVAIIAQPAFWQTLWFRAGVALACGGAVFGWYQRRLGNLEMKRQEQQEFTRQLIRAQEAERARLARELHDDITQRLARLAIDAGRVEQGGPGPQPAEAMRLVREGLVRVSEDVHSLSYKLHPSLLEDLGLTDALKAECERFSRQHEIPCRTRLCDLPQGLPQETALGLFRIAQEALRNIGRHARASGVDLMLRQLDGGLQLAIQDDGAGFNPALKQKRTSLGLAGMRERINLLGGELDIESAPAQGTTVVAWVPFNGPNGNGSAKPS